MPKPILTQLFVRSRFAYEGGKLLHKFKPADTCTNRSWNTRYGGKECKTPTSQGYLIVGIRLNGKPYSYLVHRIVYTFFYGPTDLVVDHIDHDITNNSIENLRGITPQENSKNMPFNQKNTSGFNGVYFNKANQKWQAYINVSRECFHLGCFLDKQDAIAAREAANIKYGFHPNHGER